MIPYSFNPMGIDAVQESSDLYILRQIRDANPTSQLPSFWLDSEDPPAEWEGLVWNEQKTRVTALLIANTNIITLINVNKLAELTLLYCIENQLTSLDVTGLTNLAHLSVDYNQLTSLDLTGLNSLIALSCTNNQLTSIPTLTSKGLITEYDFTYNNFPTSELDRLRAMGFTDESRLLPQNQ